jgi:hypothetical protein
VKWKPGWASDTIAVLAELRPSIGDLDDGGEGVLLASFPSEKEILNELVDAWPSVARVYQHSATTKYGDLSYQLNLL